MDKTIDEVQQELYESVRQHFPVRAYQKALSIYPLILSAVVDANFAMYADRNAREKLAKLNALSKNSAGNKRGETAKSLKSRKNLAELTHALHEEFGARLIKQVRAEADLTYLHLLGIVDLVKIREIASYHQGLADELAKALKDTNMEIQALIMASAAREIKEYAQKMKAKLALYRAAADDIHDAKFELNESEKKYLALLGLVEDLAARSSESLTKTSLPN